MMASLLPWAALTATQPLVWIAVGVAAAISLPLLLGFRMFRGPRESIARKHVLITGGSEGIGLELAKLAASRGSRVSLIARTRSKLENARAEVLAATAEAAVGIFTADVGDRAALHAAIAAAESELGAVDVCIAAAGASFPKYFEELDDKDYELMMRVNYYGIVNAARALLPRMAERAAADLSTAPHFAAVCSMVAGTPFIGYAAYAPSKAACKSFIDVLRNEYADTRVALHIAFPPDMDTAGFVRENETKPYETKHVWPEMFNDLFHPADVARALLDDMLDGHYFLRSPDVFGNLLISRSWGHFPRSRPVLEAALAPLFVGLHAVMVWMADRIVKQRNHHAALTGQR